MNKEQLRPGQRRAIDVILQRVRAGKQKPAIVLPTRYGKSDVIRLAAILSREEKTSAASIALSPSLFLCNQLVRGDKVNAMAFRYGLERSKTTMRIMRSIAEVAPFGNGEVLLSATIQLAVRNIDLFAEIVKDRVNQTGLPVLIHIDECHETAATKPRGDLVNVLESVGGLVILYTATAIRADGEMIPGFAANEIRRENAKRYVATDAGDGVNNRIDVFEGQRSIVELIAHHSTGFKEAWNEKPSPICNLSREVIDVNLNDLADLVDDVEPVSLSACAPSVARKYLAKAVRSPLVIDKAVDAFVRELTIRRRVNPDAAGIIFTCNDFEGQTNQHALEIREAITAIAPELVCRIITMKSAEDEKPAREIESFVGTDTRKAYGDVIIVKQMGGAGLDSPRIKVCLDLSPVRTVASVIQRMMRVATPWHGMRTGSVVTLADPLMNAIWRKYVVEEGGEAATFGVSANMELVDSYLKPKADGPDDPSLEILSADIASFDDNAGIEGDIANLAAVNDLLARIPALGTLHTKADLSRRLTGWNPPSSRHEPTLDDRLERYYRMIYERVKERAQAVCPYNRNSADSFRQECKRQMNASKAHAGVPLNVELRDIVNTSTLDQMLNFLARGNE